MHFITTNLENRAGDASTTLRFCVTRDDGGNPTELRAPTLDEYKTKFTECVPSIPKSADEDDVSHKRLLQKINPASLFIFCSKILLCFYS